MPPPPQVREVPCPECDALAFAVIPAGSVPVEYEEEATGKVWANCRECGERFLVYYRTDS